MFSPPMCDLNRNHECHRINDDTILKIIPVLIRISSEITNVVSMNSKFKIKRARQIPCQQSVTCAQLPAVQHISVVPHVQHISERHAASAESNHNQRTILPRVSPYAHTRTHISMTDCDASARIDLVFELATELEQTVRRLAQPTFRWQNGGRGSRLRLLWP